MSSNLCKEIIDASRSFSKRWNGWTLKAVGGRCRRRRPRAYKALEVDLCCIVVEVVVACFWLRRFARRMSFLVLAKRKAEMFDRASCQIWFSRSVSRLFHCLFCPTLQRAFVATIYNLIWIPLLACRAPWLRPPIPPQQKQVIPNAFLATKKGLTVRPSGGHQCSGLGG